MASPFLALPTELKCKILGYSDVKEVAALPLTCKNLHHVSRAELTRHRIWGAIQITRDSVSNKYQHTGNYLFNIWKRLLCNPGLGTYATSLEVEDYGVTRVNPDEYDQQIRSGEQPPESLFFGTLEQVLNRNRLEATSSEKANSLINRVLKEETSVVCAILVLLPGLRTLEISTSDAEKGRWDSVRLPEFAIFIESAAFAGELKSRVFPNLVEVRLTKGIRNFMSCISTFDLMSCFATLPTLRLLHGFGVSGVTDDMIQDPDHDWTDVPAKSSGVEDMAISTLTLEPLDAHFLSTLRKLKRLTLEVVMLDVHESKDNEVIDALIEHQRESLEYFQFTCHLYVAVSLQNDRIGRTSLRAFLKLRIAYLDIAMYWQTSLSIRRVVEHNGRVPNVKDYQTASPRLDIVLPASIEEITICGDVEVKQIDMMLQAIEAIKLQKLKKLQYVRFRDPVSDGVDPTRILKACTQRCHSVGVRLVVDRWLWSGQKFQWREPISPREEGMRRS